jgi:hypothetical protein
LKIRLESTDPGTTHTAAADLVALAHGWGRDPPQTPTPPTAATGDDQVATR